jgi:hypothetical protein
VSHEFLKEKMYDFVDPKLFQNGACSREKEFLKQANRKMPVKLTIKPNGKLLIHKQFGNNKKLPRFKDFSNIWSDFRMVDLIFQLSRIKV